MKRIDQIEKAKHDSVRSDVCAPIQVAIQYMAKYHAKHCKALQCVNIANPVPPQKNYLNDKRIPYSR